MTNLEKIMDKMNVSNSVAMVILGNIVCSYGQLCTDMSKLLNKGVINAFPSKADYIAGVINAMVKV
jgi:hypothetical protein